MTGTLDGTTIYQNQKIGGKICFEVPTSSSDLILQFNFGSSYNPVLAELTLNI